LVLCSPCPSVNYGRRPSDARKKSRGTQNKGQLSYQRPRTPLLVVCVCRMFARHTQIPISAPPASLLPPSDTPPLILASPDIHPPPRLGRHLRPSPSPLHGRSLGRLLGVLLFVCVLVSWPSPPPGFAWLPQSIACLIHHNPTAARVTSTPAPPHLRPNTTRISSSHSPPPPRPFQHLLRARPSPDDGPLRVATRLSPRA
jgi:hypothetical protein